MLPSIPYAQRLNTNPIDSYMMHTDQLSLRLPSFGFIDIIDIIPSRGTRESLPIEIISGITMTFRSESILNRTMCEWDLLLVVYLGWYMEISDIIEEMDFSFW